MYANMFNMNASQKILDILKNAEHPLSALEISKLDGTPSRTYTAHLLSNLLKTGQIQQLRQGKHLHYFISTTIYEKTLPLKNLHEDEVWNEIRKTPNFIASLSEQAETSLHFAFTEMLNNAIDHSKSGTASIKLEFVKEDVAFTIRDYGIGVFNSLQAKKNYPDTITTIQELVKGKNTSDPIHHSGEGIFWTSKIADYFELKSFNYSLIIDNTINDYTIIPLSEPILGTEVTFRINQHSEKSIRELFHQYAIDKNSLSLDATTIPIKLYDLGAAWISRSQAKKLLSGLEKYKKIIFDFNGVDLIGQGFADEIFRVFKNAHQDIILEPINMNDTIAILVNDAISNTNAV